MHSTILLTFVWDYQKGAPSVSMTACAVAEPVCLDKGLSHPFCFPLSVSDSCCFTEPLPGAWGLFIRIDFSALLVSQGANTFIHVSTSVAKLATGLLLLLML